MNNISFRYKKNVVLGGLQVDGPEMRLKAKDTPLGVAMIATFDMDTIREIPLDDESPATVKRTPQMSDAMFAKLEEQALHNALAVYQKNEETRSWLRRHVLAHNIEIVSGDIGLELEPAKASK